MDLNIEFRVNNSDKAIVPEWSKGVVLRTTKRKFAWVRTPPIANLFISILLKFLINYTLLFYSIRITNF